MGQKKLPKVTVQELEAGEKLDSEYREIHHLLARAYHGIGRKKDAMRESAEVERPDKIRRQVRGDLSASDKTQPRLSGPPSRAAFFTNPGVRFHPCVPEK